jgi:lipase maturation factor 1
LLWGKDVRPPTYFWARRWLLRALGLIYLIAFVSLWVQVDGLVGSDGVSPLNQFLPAVRAQLGGDAYLLLPTLCWFNSTNAFLHFLCGGGVALSLLLIFGIAPAFILVALFVFYLSLTIAGQIFFTFQWDVLLLETGFLSIFFAPWQLWPRDLLLWPRPTVAATASPVSRAGLFLLKFLLFKLMLMSGVVKLTSGDASWWNLTALDYHYWSQPLPTVFGWWADKSPEWFKHFSVAFCLVVEIVVPFFIWAPRRPRLIAAGLIIFLQITIAITGNYCFFNLLTIALCLLLIDDSVAASLCPGAFPRRVPNTAAQRRGYSIAICSYAAIAVIIVTLPVNAWLIFSAFKPRTPPPRLLATLYEQLGAFRIINGYGLFRVMTKDRGEILLEGSADGLEWLPYEFKWKPGDLKRPPGWCAPHQPRLDWQMWFAALESPRENPWFIGLILRLLQGSRDVNGLLAHNPFPDKPPRFIRAMFYRYRFTSAAELRQTGAWWKRQELREYFPTLSLDQLH